MSESAKCRIFAVPGAPSGRHAPTDPKTQKTAENAASIVFKPRFCQFDIPMRRLPNRGLLWDE